MAPNSTTTGSDERQNHLYIVATEGGPGCRVPDASCNDCAECIQQLIRSVPEEIRNAFAVQHCHVLSPNDSAAHDSADWLRKCGTAIRECMSHIADRNRRIIMLSSLEDAPFLSNMVAHAAQPKLLRHEPGETTGSFVIAVSPDEESGQRIKTLERAMRASKDRMNGRMGLLVGRRFLSLPGLQNVNGQLTSRFSDLGGVDKQSGNVFFGVTSPEQYPQGLDGESGTQFAAANVANILVTNGGEDASNELLGKLAKPDASSQTDSLTPDGVVFSIHADANAFGDPQKSDPIIIANEHAIPSMIVNDGRTVPEQSEISLSYVLDGRTKGMNALEAKIALSHWLGVAREIHGANNPDAVVAHVRECLRTYLS